MVLNYIWMLNCLTVFSLNTLLGSYIAIVSLRISPPAKQNVTLFNTSRLSVKLVNAGNASCFIGCFRTYPNEAESSLNLNPFWCNQVFYCCDRKYGCRKIQLGCLIWGYYWIGTGLALLISGEFSYSTRKNKTGT